MKEIYSEVEINASPKVVWDILMDFENFQNWNPFIKQISGNPQVGSKIEVFIHPPDSRGMTFKPKILDYEPEEKLRWIGTLGIPKIFDGEHSWIINEIDENKVLFIQKERFTGILVSLLGGMLKNTEKGFKMMNSALKKEAEKK
ncbi:MAG TPA: SRPBCC domain-containing protein [Methanobacterium sp.]|nr:SRPBCC domain-containing protein [Methanobacterium sp.]